MEIIYLLLPASIAFSIVALAVYIWSARSGQLDDLDTPSVRMLFDDNDEDTNKRS